MISLRYFTIIFITLISYHYQFINQNLKKESEEQKTETLELFATMERFRVTHERNNDKNYLALLRQRPLDPTRKSKMAALESALGYVSMEISKVDSILDSNLQECLDAQKRQRFDIQSLSGVDISRFFVFVFIYKYYSLLFKMFNLFAVNG